MSRILDEPELRESTWRIPRSVYHRAGELGLLGEDVELIEGSLIRKMPKSPWHQFILRRLRNLLQPALPPHTILLQESPIASEFSEPEPDLAVVEGSEADFALVHPETALLVIEVAASSLLLDRAKRSVYASCGVIEYWIVDLTSESVEQFASPDAKSEDYLQRHAWSGQVTVTSTAIPGFRVPLAQLLERPAHGL